MLNYEILSCYYISFSLGIILDFTEIAESDWLQIYDINKIQLIANVMNITWRILSVLSALLSDYLIKKHFNHHKQILYSCLFSSFLWFIISAYASSKVIHPDLILICIILSEIGVGFIHVVLDGSRAKIYNKEHVNIFMTSERVKIIGSLVSFSLSGFIFSYFGRDSVFLFQSFHLSMICYVVLLYSSNRGGEEVVVDKEEEEEQERNEESWILWAKFKNIWNRTPRICYFMFLYNCLPDNSTTMYYYYYNGLHITPWQISIMYSIVTVVNFMNTFFSFELKRYHYIILTTLNTLTLYLTFVLVTRQHVNYMGDFNVIIVITFLSTLSNGLIWLSALNIFTQLTSENNEAFDYSILLIFASSGKCIKTIIEYLLVLYYSIDHNKYDSIHILCFITLITSMLGPVFCGII
jgi:hypothetical protein